MNQARGQAGAEGGRSGRVGVVVCVAILGAASAWGQPAAQSQNQSSVPEPVGVKLGEGRLHPSFDLETRYDSFVGYFVRGVRAQELILQFRPGIRFDLSTPSTLVAFNANGEYLWYSGLLSPNNSYRLSRFQASGGLDAHFNKDGAVEFQIGDTFIRSDRTQTPSIGVGALSLFNDARVAVPIHPGGGALEFTPKVSWQIEIFEPLLVGTVDQCPIGQIACDPNAVSRQNYMNVDFGLTAKWKFLPKTAFTLDTAFDWRTYISDPASNRPAQLLRTQAGLVGLVSPRVSVTLLAGYAGDFANSVHNFIANAEVAYIPSDLTRLSVGYLRTMQPVPVYGTFGDDRGYLTGRLGLWGGRLALNAQAAFNYFTFYGGSNRNDIFFTLNGGPVLQVTSWFEAAALYTLAIRSPLRAQDATDSNQYIRHEAILRLTVRY